MKVKVIESKAKEERPYPKLMESYNGTIVLMYREGEGTVLNKGSITMREVCEYIDCWEMDGFKDFEGKLELTNK
jgi:hypothetical protein